MEDFVLPCMPLYGIICVYFCRTLITRRVHGRIYGLDLKRENGHLGNHTRFINDEENGCRFEDQGNEAWNHMCDKRGSCQGKDAGVLFRLYTLALDVIQVLDGRNKSC